AGQDIDTMRQVITWLVAPRMTQAVRAKVVDILVERTAQRNIQDLHSATYSQHRDVFLQSPACQLQFNFIKLFVRLIGERMRRFSIDGRINIDTAGKHETIQARKDR